MSGYTYSNFDGFVIKLLLCDFRDIFKIKDVFELVASNNSLMEFDTLMEITFSLQKVKLAGNSLLNNLKKLHASIVTNDFINDFINIETFYQNFLLFSQNVFAEINCVKWQLNCTCTNVEKTVAHLLGCSVITVEEKSFYLRKWICQGIFREELNTFFNGFPSCLWDKADFWPTFLQCVIKYENLCIVSEKAHEDISRLLIGSENTYKNYSLQQRQDFHDFFIEIFSLDSDSTEDIPKIRELVKNNGLKMGISYYGEVMLFLNMHGYYGDGSFLSKLYKIASAENIWTNNLDSKSTFKSLAIKIIAEDLNDEADKQETFNILNKEMSKFMRVSDYRKIMECLFDLKFVYDDIDSHFRDLYNTLREVFTYTEKNGFKDAN